MKLWGLPVVVVMTIALPVAAKAAHRYGYLTEATNRMLALTGPGMSPSAGQLAQATSQACQALKLLQEDEQFEESLRDWAALSKRTDEERKPLRRDLSYFVTVFLVAEKRVLVKAGLTNEAADKIVSTATTVRDVGLKELDPEELMRHIGNLEREICKGALKLYTIKNAQDRRSTFGRWAMGIGGVALVVFDGVSALPTAGMATASMGLGGALMGSALQ